jgi:hypothetical protein
MRMRHLTACAALAAAIPALAGAQAQKTTRRPASPARLATACAW